MHLLESGLENSEELEGHSSSSADSSEFEQDQGLEAASLLPEDRPQERPPLPIPTSVDTSLNFRLGSGGTQVREAYTKPVSPPLVPEPPLNVPRDIILRAIAGDKGATLQLTEIAGRNLQTAPPPPCSSNPSVALEYTSSQLEYTQTNLEVISKHVRKYMVTQGECVECVQPITQSALPQDMTTQWLHLKARVS